MRFLGGPTPSKRDAPRALDLFVATGTQPLRVGLNCGAPAALGEGCGVVGHGVDWASAEVAPLQGRAPKEETWRAARVWGELALEWPGSNLPASVTTKTTY